MKKVVVLVFIFALLAMGACAGMNTGGTVNADRVTVAAYEPGKSLTVEWINAPISSTQQYQTAKPAGPTTVTLEITPQTEVKGEIKPGVRVLVRYLQYGKGEGSYLRAVSIERVWN